MPLACSGSRKRGRSHPSEPFPLPGMPLLPSPHHSQGEHLLDLWSPVKPRLPLQRAPDCPSCPLIYVPRRKLRGYGWEMSSSPAPCGRRGGNSWFWVLRRAGLGQGRREREEGLASPRERRIGQPLGLVEGEGHIPEGEGSKDPGCLAWSTPLCVSPKTAALFCLAHPLCVHADLCG